MNIEAGKFYLMRCRGAVKIDEVDESATTGPHSFLYADYCWYRGGVAFPNETHPFDLVAEITEAEYNRIVSGEQAGNSEQVDITKLQQTILDLEERLEFARGFKKLFETEVNINDKLKAENEKLTRALQMKNRPDNQQREQRRFEAAKAAMQGMLSNADLDVLQDTEWIAKHAVAHADALLKALGENHEL